MINLLNLFLVLAASASLVFGKVPVTVFTDEEFAVPVILSTGGQETYGTDAVLSFDPEFLKVTRIKKGDMYPNYPENLMDIDNSQGTVHFSGTVGLYQTQKAVDGLFGRVFFQGKRPGKTTIGFIWEKGKTNDSNIVPLSGQLDALLEKPKDIEVSLKESSSEEKIWLWFKKIFSFNFLGF